MTGAAIHGARPTGAALDHPRRNLLGVDVHCVSMEEAVRSVGAMVDGGERHIVVPVNPEMIMAARINPAFQDAINGASLVVPDGIGVVYGLRYLGHEVTERVTGVDLTLRIVALAAGRNHRVFFLGAADGVAERAAVTLRGAHPTLAVAGTYAGSPHPDEEDSLCAMINAARPDILLVAYGAPKQELWATRVRARLHVPVILCVGGTFDFIAGIVPRAPETMRRLGLEWLYRLSWQPSRWRRMLALPRFAAAILFNGSFSSLRSGS